MKKIISSLCISFVLLSCSTEDIVTKHFAVTSVTKSECKQTSESYATRSEDVTPEKTILSISRLSNNSAKCQFQDISANCDLKTVFVEGVKHDSKIIVYVYKTQETIADCYCDFDVDFSLSNIDAGSYTLEVYKASGLGNISSSNRVYEGQVEISPNLDGSEQIALPKIRL